MRDLMEIKEEMFLLEERRAKLMIKTLVLKTELIDLCERYKKLQDELRGRQ